MHDLYDAMVKTASGQITLVESGVLTVLVEMALQIAGSSPTIRESDFFQASP
jgi:hypothetical protein